MPDYLSNGFSRSFLGSYTSVCYGIVSSIVFSLDSLPTFAVRAVLEVLQLHFTLLAITVADRSTFSIIRLWTIPLLLAVDLASGYEITQLQFIGISFILCSFILLYMKKVLNSKGIWLVAFTAVNAVLTLSLYKYNISNYNSVEAEQGIISIILMVYCFSISYFKEKGNPLRLFKQGKFVIQSMARGLGSLCLSFAYLYAAASVIATAQRAGSLFFALLSGRRYFEEGQFLFKIAAFFLIFAGLIFLTN